MLIRGDESYLEIEVVDRVASHLPTPGDVEFSVAASSANFTGQGFVWIDAPAMATFVQHLRALERDRHGSAQLEGMSPGLFRLRIWSIDRRGHVAVAAMIAKQVRNGEAGPYQPYQHSVEFGFEFDPTLLPKILTDFAKIAEGPGTEC